MLVRHGKYFLLYYAVNNSVKINHYFNLKILLVVEKCVMQLNYFIPFASHSCKVIFLYLKTILRIHIS